MPTSRPTDAQLSILNVLWRIGSSTVRQVHEALPDEVRRGYTTTLKLMQIMAEKGLVLRDESERSHVYTAAAEEHELKDLLVDDLMIKAFGGSSAALAMRALAQRPSSQAELDAVRQLLDRLESSSEEESR